MEMTGKANATINNYHGRPSETDRRHVRNLWPSVGGGLPGGKPVEPAGTTGLVRNGGGGGSGGGGGQSTSSGGGNSYAQTIVGPATAADAATVAFVDDYYYKSSQVGPIDPSQYAGGHYYGGLQQQQPVKFFQRPVAVDHGWPPPPPPLPLPSHSASQFYHRPDPTTLLFDQVSAARARFYPPVGRSVDVPSRRRIFERFPCPVRLPRVFLQIRQPSVDRADGKLRKLSNACCRSDDNE